MSKMRTRWQKPPARHALVTSVWLPKPAHRMIKVEAARRGMTIQSAVDHAVRRLVDEWSAEEVDAR